MARGKHSKKKTSVTTSAAATETVAPVVAPPAVVMAPVAEVVEVKPAPVATAATVTLRKPTRTEIAARAYELFRARGFQHGHAMQDWLQAEAELGLGKQ